MNSDDYREQFFTDAGLVVTKDWEMCATIPHLTLLSDFNKSWGYKLAPLLDAEIKTTFAILSGRRCGQTLSSGRDKPPRKEPTFKSGV
jgi:hypothetical protein